MFRFEKDSNFLELFSCGVIGLNSQVKRKESLYSMNSLTEKTNKRNKANNKKTINKIKQNQ